MGKKKKKNIFLVFFDSLWVYMVLLNERASTTIGKKCCVTQKKIPNKISKKILNRNCSKAINMYERIELKNVKWREKD
jgi:hypothetical protein